MANCCCDRCHVRLERILRSCRLASSRKRASARGDDAMIVAYRPAIADSRGAALFVRTRATARGAAAANRRRGFTLLEVLVAVLLLSLALVALVRLAGLDARASAQLRDGTLAQWVAANVLAETRLRASMPAVGRSNGEVKMGGQRWRWVLEVNDTEEPGIRRLDVEVVPVNALRDDGGVAARLTGFASQP